MYTQQAYIRAARVSVAPRPRDQLNAKDTDVTSLPNWYWLGAYCIMGPNKEEDVTFDMIVSKVITITLVRQMITM